MSLKKTIRSPGNQRPVDLTSVPGKTLGQVFVKTYMKFWWVLRRGIPQELMLGPELYNTLADVLGDKVAHILTKFRDDTKLGGVINTLGSKFESEKGGRSQSVRAGNGGMF